MSDFDSVQFPLQLRHINLLLFDAVDDLLLRPCYLFLITQLETTQESLRLAEHLLTPRMGERVWMQRWEELDLLSTCLLSRSVWTETVL